MRVDGHVVRAEEGPGDLGLVLLVPVEVILELELRLVLLLRRGHAHVEREHGAHEGVAVRERGLEVRRLLGAEDGVVEVGRRVLPRADVAARLDRVPAARAARLAHRLRRARDPGADAEVAELLRRVAGLLVHRGDEGRDAEEGLAARRRRAHLAAPAVRPGDHAGGADGIGAGADRRRREGRPTVRRHARAVLASVVASRERGHADRRCERRGEDAGSAMPAHGRVMPKRTQGSKRGGHARWGGEGRIAAEAFSVGAARRRRRLAIAGARGPSRSPCSRRRSRPPRCT